MTSSLREATATFFADVDLQASDALMTKVEGLASIGVERIMLAVSSPGGEVTTGLGLYAELRSAPFSELVTFSSGEVASTANLVYLAGDKRIATPQATFYLHPVFLPGRDGLEVTAETLSELRRLGERTHAPAVELRQLDLTYARLKRYERETQAIFVDRTDLRLDQIDGLMRNRSTLDASAARAVGIVHEIVSSD